MGVLSDLLSTADTFDATPYHNVPLDRIAKRQLQGILDEIGDFDYPTGYAARNEVQSIAVFGGTVTDGTYNLTFTLKSGETFDVEDIAYNASAATVLGLLNTAAAAVTGWTNGDIAVSGGHLGSAPMVFTFSGNSVKSLNHPLIVIDGTELTGGTAGAVSTTTQGQTNRAAWALLNALGIITSAAPAQGADATGVTVGYGRGEFPLRLSNEVVKLLVEEAAYDDGHPQVKTALLTALDLL